MDKLYELMGGEGARLIREGAITSEQLVQSCLDRVREVDGDVQAWAFLDPEYALAQARAADEFRGSGRPLGSLARGARRHQGHHRHGRHAHRERLRAPRRADAVARRERGGDAARRGRRHHGQDRDDGVRHEPSRQDAQPAQPGPHAGRLLQRFGGGGRRGHGAARPRQPDDGIDHPPGVVLRRLRLQADPRPDSPLTGCSSSRGRSTTSVSLPAPSTTSPCSWKSSRATTSAIPTRGRARGSRIGPRPPRSRRCRRCSVSCGRPAGRAWTRTPRPPSRSSWSTWAVASRSSSCRESPTRPGSGTPRCRVRRSPSACARSGRTGAIGCPPRSSPASSAAAR